MDNHAKYDDMTGEPISRRWYQRKALLALVLMATVIPAVFAAAYLSNLFPLGPYTGKVPITISQITTPATASGCLVGTYETDYTGAAELPLSASDIALNIWYKTAILVVAPTGSVVPVKEHYSVVYSGSGTPISTDLKLVYCSQTDPKTWTVLSPTYDVATHTWTGTVTDIAFTLPISYSATTPLLMMVTQPGLYTSTLWFEAA